MSGRAVGLASSSEESGQGSGAEIMPVITAITNLSSGEWSSFGFSALRADGHTWFYSQAKEKKEAILFT